jgi:cell division protein FtsB
MKLFRILVPVFFGIAAYSLFGICFGPKGIRAMQQLECEKGRLTENLDSLTALNADLKSSLDNLSADPDTISVYAHELGLINEGEHLIKLAGFTGGINRKMIAGSAIEVEPPRYFPEWGCKLVGVFAYFISSIALSLLSGEKKHGYLKKILRFG